MKRVLPSLAALVLLAGCSQQSSTEQAKAGSAAPAPANTPPAAAPATPPPAPTTPPPSDEPPPEPTTMYAKAIRRAENVSALVTRKANEAADVITEEGLKAAEKLKSIQRSDVDAWLSEQKQLWTATSARIAEKAKAKGVDAEPAVRSALESLRAAREAAEKKVQRFKSAAETELPRLRTELQDAFRKVREQEQQTEKTVDQTA